MSDVRMNNCTWGEALAETLAARRASLATGQPIVTAVQGGMKRLPDEWIKQANALCCLVKGKGVLFWVGDTAAPLIRMLGSTLPAAWNVPNCWDCPSDALAAERVAEARQSLAARLPTARKYGLQSFMVDIDRLIIRGRGVIPMRK